MVNDFFISVYQQSWGNGSTGQLSLHQVKLKISHHTLKTSDGSIAPSKDLIFVMDDPPEEPTKKKAKTKKNSKDDASTAGVTTKTLDPTFRFPSSNIAVCSRLHGDAGLTANRMAQSS